jgi:hypothetical protein
VDCSTGATKAALIVPVPEAEEVVGHYRRILDHTASWPVPAHVTVLYPFVAPEHITEAVIDDVAACLATVPAFTCNFSRIAWFGQEVVWLAPEPDAGFRALTKQVVDQFPECPPYRGAIAAPTPHLTVGSAHLADFIAMQRAAAEIEVKLPIRCQVDRVHLMVGSNVPGSWRSASGFMLGPA